MAQSGGVAFGTTPQDTSAPVEATSDELFVDEQTGSAVFSGDVVIAQGELRLSAQRVEVSYVQDQDQIDRIEATGGVTLVSGPDAAEAETAFYDMTARIITMRGNVLMTQGQQVLSGEELVISIDNGTARMSGRVRTVLQGGD
ncbi:MAG: lipopolysaccharide transport periplasmic protein LptA [Rhodobacteraceae bacterium]|nr:lipopolysaccharide transport periplasmic protein LptA [Paracoccaceae bacterium]